MPLYAFRCPECRHEHEELVGFGWSPEEGSVRCPACESVGQERLLGVTAAPRGDRLPIAGCPPSDAPPCHPQCCRIR